MVFWLPVLCVFALATATSPTSASDRFSDSLCNPDKDWELVLNEEFEGTELNTSLWTARSSEDVGHFNEMQYYSPYNVEVRDGYLVIESRKDFYKGKRFTSAWIDSQGKFSTLFGRVCIGAILPPGKAGLWPAHWMLPENSNCYTGRSEIDIMEMINGDAQVHGSLHFNVSWKLNDRKPCAIDMLTCTGTVTNDDFTNLHEYSVSWSPDSLTFYLDAQPYVTCYPTKSNNSRIPMHSMFIILNTAIGGGWPSPPTPATIFPQHHLVDYVRVLNNRKLGGEVQWNGGAPMDRSHDGSPRRLYGPHPPSPGKYGSYYQ